MIGVGGVLGVGGYFVFCLFLWVVYVDFVLFFKVMNVLWVLVEVGYMFYGFNMVFMFEVVGYFYLVGVNFVWRESVMYVDIFGFSKFNFGIVID